jgi:hypothetical protein
MMVSTLDIDVIDRPEPPKDNPQNRALDKGAMIIRKRGTSHYNERNNK